MRKIRAVRKVRALPAAAVVAVLVGGCATPPSPESGYSTVLHDVVQASANYETDGPATLPTEESLSGPHDVTFYVTLALERNPNILAARRAVAAVTETIPQETSLDNPLLETTFWPDPERSPQTIMGRMPVSIMARQDVPWLAKLRVRGEVAEQEAKIALASLAREELSVVEQIRIAYFDLYYLQKATAVTRENEELLEDLVGFAEIRFRTGGSQQDVLRVEIERERLRNQLIDYERQLVQAQADLAALVHASPDVEPLASESLDLPAAPEALDRLYELAARCRPELRERVHEIVRDQRRRELARLEYYPDFTVGVAYDVMTTQDAMFPTPHGGDNIGVIAGVSMPIWQDRLRAGVREAEHRAVESARRYDAERDDSFRQIRRFVAAADAAARQRLLYRESIVPRAEQALEISIADYRVGKTDILQVVNNYTELLNFEIQLARFEADFGQAIASLDRVVGCEVAAYLPAVASSAPPAPAPAAEDDAAEEEPQTSVLTSEG
ncbi:MAG: TolC family protein [Planctomycetaceae bacterium]